MDIPVREVVGVQAYIPTTEDIIRTSVLKVEKPEDVSSPLLGVTDWGEHCRACDSKLEDCHGHFGHLIIPIPIFRIFYIQHTMNILQNICFYCQNLRLPKTDPHYKFIASLEPEYRLENLTERSRAYKRCGCMRDQTLEVINYTRDCGKLFVQFDWEDKKTKMVIKAIVPLDKQDVEEYEKNPKEYKPVIVNPQTITDCLRHLTPETLHMLGVVPKVNDPVACMWEVLPIPSHNTRPVQVFDSIKNKKKHEWTKLLGSIVTCRNDLNAAIANASVVEDPGIQLTTYVLNGYPSKSYRECFVVNQMDKSDRDSLKKSQTELMSKQAQWNQKQQTTYVKPKLLKGEKKPIPTIDQAWRRLNEIVAAFHSTRHRKFANKNSPYGSPPKPVEARFTGQKQARHRGTIVAVRVEHAMRGVLEGSYFLYPNQCSIAISRAMLQTYEEPVTIYNVKEMYKRICNGPFQYPGANFVVLNDGREINLSLLKNRRSIDMNTVKTVKRHLQDGDIALVNRQPTLHRPSTFGVYLKIVDEKCFRLHYATFKNLGADCDGDELTIHIPQTPDARAEAISIMGIEQCIMKNGVVWVGFIENMIVAASMMTQPGFTLTRQMMTNVCSAVPDIWDFPLAIDSSLKKQDQRYSGHSIFSLILPKNFTLVNTHVVIRDGEFISGHLNAEVLNGPKGIVATMCRDLGTSITLKFIYDGYLLFAQFIQTHGLSVGYFDGAKKIEDIAKTEVDVCVKNLTLAVDQFQSKHTPELEEQIKQHIDLVTKMSVDESFSYHANSIRAKQNGLLTIIKSGAKGSEATFNMICGRMAQIYVLNKRFQDPLPYFMQGKDLLLQNGFVNENYALGISVRSALMEAHSTTENVSQKHKGTANYGYLQRKLEICMMGVVVNHKKQCVDTNGRVIWDLYGNDGFDSTYLTIVTVPDRFHECLEMTDENMYYQQLVRNLSGLNTKFCSPFDLKHVLDRASSLPTQEPLVELFSFVTQMWNQLVQANLIFANHYLLKHHVFHWLHSSVWHAKKFGIHHLVFVFEIMRDSLIRCSITPGESVGSIGSQELGEPVSQQILKIQHLSSKVRNAITAPARISNIIDGSFEHNQELNIVLKESITNEMDAKIFALSLLRCTLSEICEFPEIQFFSHECIVKYVFHKLKTIQRIISVRNVARLLAMHLDLPLTQFRTSFANDEHEWFMEVRIPYMSTFWSKLEESKSNFYKGANYHQQRVPLMEQTVHFIYSHIVIHGLSEIENFFLIQRDNRWVVVTCGSNLARVLKYKEVDANLTTSNNCEEMCRIFGLRVAGKSLEHELSGLFANMSDMRHVKLVARMMIRDSKINGMKIRQSAKKIPMLQRASYEHNKDEMVRSCVNAEYDHAETTCGAAIANKRMGVGTGYNLTLLTTLLKEEQKPIYDRPCDYVVSFKVDGLRVLMTLFVHNGIQMVTMMNRNDQVFELLTPKHLGFSSPSVFDGDLVIIDKIPVFIIHDILVSHGHTMTNVRYDLRLEIARANWNVFLHDVTNKRLDLDMGYKYSIRSQFKHISQRVVFPGIEFGNQKLGITVKPIFNCSQLDKLKQLKFMFPIDGYIFTSAVCGLSAFRNNMQSVLKWKQLNDQTIDVTIKYASQDHTLVNIPNRLMCYQIGVPLKSVMILRNGEVFSYIDSSPSHLTCECSWNGMEWVVTRTRQKQPNTIDTVLRTLQCIDDNIQLSDI